MAKRRFVLAAVVLLLLAGTGAIVWSGLGGPPPRLFLRYGRPATVRPTGDPRVMEGVAFVDYDRGYVRMGSHELCQPGDLVGALFPPLGIEWGEEPAHAGAPFCPRWVEVPHRFCIALRKITAGQFWRLRHPDREIFREMNHPKRCFRRRAEEWCERLASVTGREIRLPEQRELAFLHAGGPIPKRAWKRSAYYRFADEWFRERPVSAARSRELAFRPVFTLPDE